LILISTCGFGNSLSWDFNKTSSDEALGQLSFGDVLEIVSQHHIALLLILRWVFKLPIKRPINICFDRNLIFKSGTLSSSIQRIEEARNAVEGFMQKMVQTRRAEFAASGVTQDDIMNLMIQSSEGEGKFAMEDSALVSTFAPRSIKRS
jgi:hypothetical protein